MKKHLYKVLILGDPNVGKTSLMNVYVMNKFSSIYKATIGADFLTKTIGIGTNVVTLQIWDTSGQERFNSLGMPFYRGADCCIFVYDVTNEKSLDNIEMWCSQLQSCIDPNNFSRMKLVLVANKVDLERKTSKFVEDIISKKYGMELINISAKDMLNINAPFEYLAEECLKIDEVKQNQRDLPSEVYLSQELESKSNKCC